MAHACGALGCDVAPAGINDTCHEPTNYPDAGTSCPAGNGTYCGQTLGRDSSTLYNCVNGTITVAQTCGGTCQVHPAGTPDSCPCPSADGYYCGNDELGLNASTLYECQGGQLTSSQTCSAGCSVEPSGTNDFCTGGCSGQTLGWYCGNDGLGLTANTRYHCDGVNAAPDAQQPCANGCHVEPAGTDDICNASSCPGADGLYCGNDGLGLNANVLYQCQSGATTVVQFCSHACVTETAGTNDHCDTCPSGDGLYCGNDGLGLDANTLYSCSGGFTTVAQACGQPCQSAVAGQPDSCPGSNTCSTNGAEALSWEATQLSEGISWSDLCLGFVNNAFILGAGQTISELAQYSAADSLGVFRNEGKLIAWSGSCPCGALLFWDANSCNGNDGHVVICNGDGTVSTSGWPGFAGSTHATISWLESEECNADPAGYVVP